MVQKSGNQTINIYERNGELYFGLTSIKTDNCPTRMRDSD